MRFGSRAPDDEAETQQIPRRTDQGRAIPRLPAGLDPAGRGAMAGTEVMSLDELMDLAAETSVTAAPAPAPAAAPARPPAPAPARGRPAEPAVVVPAEPAGPNLRQQMIDDAREWLRKGDNGLIAATVVLALLLLLVVAAL